MSRATSRVPTLASTSAPVRWAHAVDGLALLGLGLGDAGGRGVGVVVAAVGVALRALEAADGGLARPDAARVEADDVEAAPDLGRRAATCER